MTPINEGLFNSNWRKRNSAILLSGEMITVLKQYGMIDEDNMQDSKDVISTKKSFSDAVLKFKFL